MAKTHEELNIIDAFEGGDLWPFFQAYILVNKKPPKDMISRMQFLIDKHSLRPAFYQDRRGRRKKPDAAIVDQINVLDRVNELRNEMSATDAQATVAKEFGISETEAKKRLSLARYIYRRLEEDGKSIK